MRRRFAIMSAVLTLLLPVAAHCASAPASQTKQADKSKMGHSMNMGGGAAAAEGSELAPSGKVVETMNGGDYSYAKLEKSGKTVWIAFPAQETRVGDTLTFGGCMEMDDFRSKSLNRKFDLILFCGAPRR